MIDVAGNDANQIHLLDALDMTDLLSVSSPYIHDAFVVVW